MATREQTYPGHTHSDALAARGAPVTPVPLMQIATGFWAFKTLAAAHELDLFTRLAVLPAELVNAGDGRAAAAG
jgi:hypothetical protein